MTKMSSSTATATTNSTASDGGVLAMEKGKRTGVTIDHAVERSEEDGLEDVDKYFAAAAMSPEKSETDDSEDEESKRSNKKKKQIRFSLDSEVDDKKNEEEEGQQSTVKTTATVRKMIAKGTRGLSLSPSELSRVSTAPPSEEKEIPSPFEEKEEEEEEEEEDIEQARKMDETVEEEETVQHKATHLESPDAFPITTDVPEEEEEQQPLITQQQEDEDDMIPPPPPDSPEPEEPVEEEEEEQPHATKPESPVDFPTEVDDYDDDDDDDKEGEGFNMAASEEETESVVEKQKEKKSKKKKKKDRKLDESTEEEESDAETAPKKKKGRKKKTKKRKLSDESTEEEESEAETAPKKKKGRKKKRKLSDESDDEETVKTAPAKKPKRKKTKQKLANFSPKGLQAGPREFTAVPVSDLKDSPDPSQKGLRRSGRAHVKPLEFWKNETYIYGPNDFDEEKYDSLINMPVPKAVNKAEPTPYKKRKVTAAQTTATKSKSKKQKTAQAEAAEPKPFDSKALRKKYEILDGDEAYMWDETTESTADLKVIAYSKDLVGRDLPRAKTRKKGESKAVGKAAQAFNVTNDANLAYPGYIMGNLYLPPTAVKDAESVGSCAQTFTFVSGQAKSLEIAFGDPENNNGLLDPKTAQRFLVSPGDMFRIPPGNCYRLENHSSEDECFLTWTIVRSLPVADAMSPE